MLFEEIKIKSLAYNVAVVSHSKIDKINILNATLLAMLNSVKKLNVKPDLILVDGNKSFNYEIPVRAIVKGDSKSFCIAAASIVAKVTRDRLMKRLANYYPAYRWERNKGYATQEHIQTLKLIGSSPLHRKTFLKNILIPEKESELDLQTVE